MADPFTDDRSFLAQGRNFLQGLGRGATTDLVGAPVDILNMVLKALDDTRVLPKRFSTEKPVMGSEWLADRLREGGMMNPETHSGEENIGRVIGGFGVTPATIARTGQAAEKTAKIVGSELDKKIAQYMVDTGLSPQILASRKGATNMGGETAAKFQAGEMAAAAGMDEWGLMRNFNYGVGAEGKGRFEIPSYDTAINPRAITDTQSQGYKIDDLWDHPKLYKAFPEILDRTVAILNTTNKSASASVKPSGNIEINLPKGQPRTPEVIRTALEHEVQHIVQKLEGLPGGTNPRKHVDKFGEIKAEHPEIKEMLAKPEYASIVRALESAGYKSKDLDPAMVKYLTAMGETEARNAQYRLANPDMQKTPFGVTEDLEREWQWVSKGSEENLQIKEPELVDLHNYADQVKDSNIKSVSLIGSGAKPGKHRDIDLLYDLGDQKLPVNEDDAAEFVSKLLESSKNIDFDRADSFFKAGDRYFHMSGGAGRMIVENTEYGRFHAGKLSKPLGTK